MPVSKEKINARISRIPNVQRRIEYLLRIASRKRLLHPQTHEEIQNTITELTKQNPYEAAKAFAKAGKYAEGALRLTAAGHHLYAAWLLEEIEEYYEAGKAHLRAGQPWYAAKAFAEAGKHAEGAQQLSQAGHHLYAAWLLEQGGMHYQAGEAYLRLGNHIAAFNAFLRAGKPEEGAEQLLHHGLRRYAIQLLRRAYPNLSKKELNETLDRIERRTYLLRPAERPPNDRLLIPAGPGKAPSNQETTGRLLRPSEKPPETQQPPEKEPFWKRIWKRILPWRRK